MALQFQAANFRCQQAVESGVAKFFLTFRFRARRRQTGHTFMSDGKLDHAIKVTGVIIGSKHDVRGKIKRTQTDIIHVHPKAALPGEQLITKPIAERTEPSIATTKDFARRQNFVTILHHRTIGNAADVGVGVKMKLMPMVDERLDTEFFQIGEVVADPQRLDDGQHCLGRCLCGWMNGKGNLIRNTVEKLSVFRFKESGFASSLPSFSHRTARYQSKGVRLRRTAYSTGLPGTSRAMTGWGDNGELRGNESF